MTKSFLWRSGVVLAVLIWAIVGAWPPNDQSVLKVFAQKAQSKDADFEKLIAAANQKHAKANLGEYEALRDAIAEQKVPLKKYFPTEKLSQDDQDEALQEYLKAPAHNEKASADTVAQANRLVLRKLLHDAAGKIGLGLDLKGGSSFQLRMDTSKLEEGRREMALSQVVEIIRRRVDALGVSEPLIQPIGTDRIMVQIPGALTDEQRAEAAETLRRVSVLEFRLIYQSDDKDPRRSQAEMLDYLARGETPFGYEVKETRERHFNKKTKKNEWITKRFLVKDRPEQNLTGFYIKRAFPYQMPGGVVVSFEFNSEGAKIFENITRENVDHQLAIMLDGKLHSAPVINEVIYGNGQISGSFDLKEAIALANTLQNPLQYPLTIEEERTVSATLGAESVKAGFYAGVIGISLVFAFMAVYYFWAGIIANICQILNLVLLLGVLAQFGLVLTLPGIAGLILTVGMAVDSNVLIYERLREELATGKSLRSAIPLAYRRAGWTIFDANATTIITAIVLIKFGAGPVLGFAVVLTVGILTSVFAALFVSRLMFDALTVRDTLKRLPMLHLIPNARVNFLRWRNIAMTFSALLILASFATFFARGKQMYGVDFTGGESFTMRYEQKISTEKLSDELTKTGFADFALQYQTQLGASGGELLHVKTPEGAGRNLQAALQEKFPDAKFEPIGQFDKVGPALGIEFAANSAIGLAIGILGILIYVSLRFEFSFAVGAIVALFHDVIITIGIMVMLGYQLNLPMIGAILTIAGYSINDTIVIFDRIREGLKIKTGSLEEIMNTSINETLSRTILTGGATILTLLAIFGWGGKTIHDFALALLIGVLVGTYSSIFIASPIVLLWGKRKGHEAGEKMAARPMQS